MPANTGALRVVGIHVQPEWSEDDPLLSLMRVVVDMAASRHWPAMQQLLMLEGVERVTGVPAYFGTMALEVGQVGTVLAAQLRQMRIDPAHLAWLRVGKVDGGQVLAGCVPESLASLPDEGQRRWLDLFFEELSRLAARGWLTAPGLSETIASPWAGLRGAGRGLTARQRQVLLMLLRGRHIKGIAHELDVSVHTLREHLRNLYRRCQVSSRDELMRLFMSR